MFKTMSEQQINNLFQQQVIGRIGCYDGEKVYVVPISYVFHEDCVYAHSQEGLKISIMRNNPSVCFQVDNTKDLSNWASAIGWGEFAEITDEKEKAEAFEKLNSRKLPHIISETMHLSDVWPFTDVSAATEGIFFKIILQKKTGRYEQSADSYFFAT